MGRFHKAQPNFKGRYVTLPKFYPRPPKNLHRYICRICDIMKLCLGIIQFQDIHRIYTADQCEQCNHFDNEHHHHSGSTILIPHFNCQMQLNRPVSDRRRRGCPGGGGGRGGICMIWIMMVMMMMVMVNSIIFPL